MIPLYQIMKWLVGVDEAGRGPLAGPVAVGVAVVPYDFDWSLIPHVGDSKKVTEKRRAQVFLRTTELQREGALKFKVSLISAKVIDEKGISKAVVLGIEKCLQDLDLDRENCDVRLDGLLKAPQEYLVQRTIIKGDGSEPVIGLASIMAKVSRDNYMEQLAGKSAYSKYELSSHKGYGTKRHIELIKEHGLSDIHRVSFCQGCLK